MRPRKKHTFFVVLLFYVTIGGNIWAANRVNLVEVNGDKLSVHSEGMPLSELLVAVESMTGVQFSFDPSLTERKLFVDFKGLPLSKGIEKIVYPLNSLKIYNGSGKLWKVFILERWKDSGVRAPKAGRNESPEGLRAGPLDVLSLEPKGSETSTVSKVPSLGKRSVQLDGPSVKGWPDRQDQVKKGPPLSRPYSVDGPPKTENEKLMGPLDARSTDHSPLPGFGGSPIDRPPLDWEYEMDGPPGWQDQ